MIMLKSHQRYLERGSVTLLIEKEKLDHPRRNVMKPFLLIQGTILKDFMMLNNLIVNGR